MPSVLERLIEALFKKVVKYGNGVIRTASGHTFTVGDGKGKLLKVVFQSKQAQLKLIKDPELALGELFMDGELTLEGGTIYDLHMIAMTNMMANHQAVSASQPPLHMRALFWGLEKGNTLKKAHRNVAHHYNLSRELYEMFLDSDLQYSCAYFERPDVTLDEAQLAKKRHIVAKLCFDNKVSMSVLDIGCGWGGLALYIAHNINASVKGITLSTEQLEVARERTRAAGCEVQSRVNFELEDYRKIEKKFDRIVSVGMLEHVGRKHLEEYFCKVASMLNPDGVALIHTIGRTDGPDVPNAWITKYIFPGGYIPSLSEITRAVERSGLFITDIEVMRLHYAKTLRKWRERFLERRGDAVELYDERFCKMWEFYLAASEASFRVGQNVNYQVQVAKKVENVPFTRSYIENAETQLRLKSEKQVSDQILSHL